MGGDDGIEENTPNRLSVSPPWHSCTDRDYPVLRRLVLAAPDKGAYGWQMPTAPR
jgi:hypothetical protein